MKYILPIVTLMHILGIIFTIVKVANYKNFALQNDPAAAQTLTYGLRAVRDIQFCVDRGDMEFNGMFTDPQSCRDLFVRQPFG